jgi:hypothetical protein
MRWISLLCVSIVSLWGQTAMLTLPSDGVLTTFPLDPSSRGAALIAMFNTLTKAPYVTSQSEIALQTLRNGLIVDVQSITPATHSTMFLVSYYPFWSPTVLQYIVLPVEQIVEMVFSLRPFTQGMMFNSSYPPGVVGTLPIFSVDLVERAEDLINMFTILNTQSPYKQSSSQVALQTTLNGSYTYAQTGMAPISGGVIPKIQSITLVGNAPGGTMMLVSYEQSVYTGNIIVTPEQVYGMVYTMFAPL